MGTIKTRHYVFRQKPRRLRAVALVGLLGSAVFGVTAVSGGDAGFTQGGEEVLTRLTAPSGPLDADRADFAAARDYEALGGTERFALEIDGRTAFIRFACPSSAAACGSAETEAEEGATAELRAVSGPEGETVLIDQAGVPVIRISITGGMTLLYGSDILPASVPRTGRAMLPADSALARAG